MRQDRPPELSVIIVSYKVRRLLLGCLKTLETACRGLDHEIIVVDNASGDGTVDVVRETYPRINVLANSENAGFAKANNQAYAISRGGFVLMLNPDTAVRPDAVRNVLDFMKRTPDAGLAGCRQMGVDNRPQRSIRAFHTVGGNLLAALGLGRLLPGAREADYYRREPFPIGYPSGAFMMARRAAVAEPRLLNEKYYMYSEEPDLALRLRRRGWRAYFVPSAEIIHFGGQSTRQASLENFLLLQRSQLMFYRIHYPGPYAVLLQLSWGAILLSTWLGSKLMELRGGCPERTRLFGRAVRAFPGLMKKAWRS